MFHVVARTSGSIRAFEIFNFEQTVGPEDNNINLQLQLQDLVDDDVMFLDSGDEIYIWVGKDATPEETGQALELATKYLDTDPTER